MLDRFVSRVPLLLMILVLAYAAHVAIVEAGQPRMLLASVPTAVLAILYLQAGRGK